MSTLNRRITVTLSPELEETLELLKKVFYAENESVIARILMENGVDALYGRKKETEAFARLGKLAVIGEHGRKYARKECSPISLIGEYIFPNVRLKVEDIQKTFTEVVTHAKVVYETAGRVEHTDGIITVDGILYVSTPYGYEMYPIAGKYVRGRRPVMLEGRTYIPFLLKSGLEAAEDENAEIISGFSDGGDMEYYFCAQDGEVYRYDRKGKRLVCQNVSRVRN